MNFWNVLSENLKEIPQADFYNDIIISKSETKSEVDEDTELEIPNFSYDTLAAGGTLNPGVDRKNKIVTEDSSSISIGAPIRVQL